MLRKLLTVGALVVVAVVMGAGNAPGKSSNPGPAKPSGNAFGYEGFSDGRLGQ